MKHLMYYDSEPGHTNNGDKRILCTGELATPENDTHWHWIADLGSNRKPGCLYMDQITCQNCLLIAKLRH